MTPGELAFAIVVGLVLWLLRDRDPWDDGLDRD